MIAYLALAGLGLGVLLFGLCVLALFVYMDDSLAKLCAPVDPLAQRAAGAEQSPRSSRGHINEGSNT